MGNNFTPPQIEKRNNAVEQQMNVEISEEQNTIGTRQNSTPVDIYKNGIDEFREFITNKSNGGDLEARNKYQRKWITSIWNMLQLSDPQVKEILDYFIISVKKYPNAFQYDQFVAPLYAIEGKLPSDEVERYKRFCLFILMYAENTGNKAKFLANYDLTKFERMFDPVSAQRIHTYVHR